MMSDQEAEERDYQLYADPTGEYRREAEFDGGRNDDYQEGDCDGCGDAFDVMVIREFNNELLCPTCLVRANEEMNGAWGGHGEFADVAPSGMPF